MFQLEIQQKDTLAERNISGFLSKKACFYWLVISFDVMERNNWGFKFVKWQLVTHIIKYWFCQSKHPQQEDARAFFFLSTTVNVSLSSRTGQKWWKIVIICTGSYEG